MRPAALLGLHCRWRVGVASGSTAGGPGGGQGPERPRRYARRHEDDDPLSMIVMLPIQADRTAASRHRCSPPLQRPPVPLPYLAPAPKSRARSSTFVPAPARSHGCVATSISKHYGTRTAPIIAVARFARQPSAAAVPSTHSHSAPSLNVRTRASGYLSLQISPRVCQNNLRSLPTKRALPRRCEPPTWPVQTSRLRS